MTTESTHGDPADNGPDAENIALVDQLWRAIENADIDALAALLTEDFLFHSLFGDVALAAYKDLARQAPASREARFAVLDRAVAGDVVWSRYVNHMKHVPSGREVDVPGLELVTP